MLKAMASPIPPHLLRVTVNTTFTPARLGSIVGWFAADFTLENTSEVEACHPFIAFSMLGLHFVKNEGWVQDYFDIRVAKRMLRFRSRQHSLGAGKCAFDIAKQMALNQVGVEGGAIDRNKRARAPTAAMNVLRQQTLARAGLAVNEHRVAARRREISQFCGSLHAG